MRYEDGWDPSLRTWWSRCRTAAGSSSGEVRSYIPFWAGEHNTGACYEWAEMLVAARGAVDCVEPLMDKELRYGRVEIVESTPARVHVRWTLPVDRPALQGLGRRGRRGLLLLPRRLRHPGRQPEDRPGGRVRAERVHHPHAPGDVSVRRPARDTSSTPCRSTARMAVFRFPFRPETDGDPRRSYTTPAIYRLRLGK